MTALSRTINAKKKLSRSKFSTRLYQPWIKTIQNGSRLIGTYFSATSIRSRLKSRRQSKATRMVTSPSHYSCWRWSSQDDKTAAAPGEVQDRCEPRFDQIPRHSFIQRCSARACRSRTLLDRIAQRGYTSWEPRLCQWIDIILYSIIIASSSCRDSRYVGSPRKIVFSVEGSKPYISYTVRSEI